MARTDWTKPEDTERSFGDEVNEEFADARDRINNAYQRLDNLGAKIRVLENQAIVQRWALFAAAVTGFGLAWRLARLEADH